MKNSLLFLLFPCTHIDIAQQSSRVPMGLDLLVQLDRLPLSRHDVWFHSVSSQDVMGGIDDRSAGAFSYLYTEEGRSSERWVHSRCRKGIGPHMSLGTPVQPERDIETQTEVSKGRYRWSFDLSNSQMWDFHDLMQPPNRRRFNLRSTSDGSQLSRLRSILTGWWFTAIASM